jgi:programmed cell death protein 5
MAEDEGLEAIRAKRLAELQAQYDGGQSDHQDHQKQQATKRREEDMKNSVLSQILEQGARARLNSIALVKPDKAKSVEMMLIRMAQSGQISGKVGEGQLVELLERINQQTQKSTKVKFERRRQDSDDEF